MTTADPVHRTRHTNLHKSYWCNIATFMKETVAGTGSEKVVTRVTMEDKHVDFSSDAKPAVKDPESEKEKRTEEKEKTKKDAKKDA
ncbi:hypothetical protein CEP53_004495 [Fusarium sp. AF-6]|nr:hypothetical protein CEP53_004495 [Fusarium sp. AF-6]